MTVELTFWKSEYGENVENKFRYREGNGVSTACSTLDAYFTRSSFNEFLSPAGAKKKGQQFDLLHAWLTESFAEETTGYKTTVPLCLQQFISLVLFRETFSRDFVDPVKVFLFCFSLMYFEGWSNRNEN